MKQKITTSVTIICFCIVLCLGFFTQKTYAQLEVDKDIIIGIETLAQETSDDAVTDIAFTDIDLSTDNLLKFEQNPVDYTAQTDTLNTAKDLSSVCDSEINNAIQEYKAEQARIAAEKAAAAEKAKVKNEIASRAGMYGRLTISGTSVNVALISCSLYGNSQVVVDARDSAAFITDFATVIIADHVNQGFSAMKSAVPGSTKAYINRGDYTDTYICTANFQGHNTGSDLTDASYNSVLNGNPGGLLMYTCNENWQNVTITYWSKI